jgi:hypothetical protein
VPAELAIGGLDDQAGSARLDHERRDAVVGAGGDRDDAGDRRARVGDERLRAVDHPLVVDQPGPGARRPRVAAGVGLGQPEGAERPTGDEIGQPARLLVVVAEAEDRVGAKPDAGREGDAERLVDASDLLDGDAQRDEVAVAAAPLAREHEPEQAELAHLLHDLQREVVGLVPGGDVGGDLGLGEVADDLAEREVLC